MYVLSNQLSGPHAQDVKLLCTPNAALSRNLEDVSHHEAADPINLLILMNQVTETDS